MKKFYLLIISISIMNSVISATKYWIGPAGNYSDGSRWNSMSDGTGSPGAPINTDNIVIDRNATINIDGNYFPSSVSVINNAIVTFGNVSATARTYTIGGGAVSPAFTIEAGSILSITGTAAITIAIATGSTASVSGILEVTGANSKMDHSFGSGVTTVKTGGRIRYGGVSGNGVGATSTLVLEAGSIYEVFKNGGSFPTATYDANSLLLNTGAVTSPAIFSMNSATGSYGNYEFNSPASNNISTGFNNDYTFNNITITNTGSGKWIYSTNPSTAYTLTINGNLTTASGTTIEINAAASGSQATIFLVKGNLINTGMITESNANTGSLIEMGGAGASAISTAANGISNDISFKINKPAGVSVTALTDITLPNSSFSRLTLTSGNIDMLTNNKLLFLQNGAFTALIGGTVNSHIIGKLKRNSNQIGGYGFPVSNNAAQLAKATITTSSPNATAWTVDFLPVNINAGSGLTAGVIDIVSDYAWDISRSGATPSNADFLTFFYGGLTSSQVLIPAQVKVVHWNGSSWNNLGGTDGGGSVDNSLGSTGGAAPGDPVTTFSPFAIGGTLGTLPVLIEYFSGIRINSTHKLTWKINCTGATNIAINVERSADGMNFNSIYTITADALRCLLPFDNTDINPCAGMNYYRIKTTDAEGKVTYSRIISLLNKQSSLEIVSFSPNPVLDNNYAKLNVASAQKSYLKIVITDMAGKTVYVRKNIAIVAGGNQLPLNFSNFSAGIYQITGISSEGNKITTSFVKE